MNCERNMNNKTENKEKLLAIQEILMHNESHMGFLLLFICYMGSDGFCPQLCSWAEEQISSCAAAESRQRKGNSKSWE